ncbi:MAG: hypothetical protein IPP17_26000 [Bacteroidetes bacterium]|nr:hypothetical protein [Bacteroidota bacterium]
MKIFTLKALFTLLAAVVIMGSPDVKACNLSGVSLCGVYKTPLLNPSFPGDSMICIRLSVGWGVTGAANGADGDTRSISFGWSTHRSGFMINAFSPATVTSGRGFANCTMPGADIGAHGAPYNSQATIIYIDPGYYGLPPCFTQPYGCITNTPLCGNIGQSTTDFFFRLIKFLTPFVFTELKVQVTRLTVVIPMLI